MVLACSWLTPFRYFRKLCSITSIDYFPSVCTFNYFLSPLGRGVGEGILNQSALTPTLSQREREKCKNAGHETPDNPCDLIFIMSWAISGSRISAVNLGCSITFVKFFSLTMV